MSNQKLTLRRSKKSNKFNFSEAEASRLSEFQLTDQKGYIKRTITPHDRQIGLPDKNWPDASLTVYGLAIPEGGIQMPSAGD